VSFVTAKRRSTILGLFLAAVIEVVNFRLLLTIPLDVEPRTTPTTLMRWLEWPTAILHIPAFRLCRIISVDSGWQLKAVVFFIGFAETLMVLLTLFGLNSFIKRAAPMPPAARSDN
jgi:hypothetical protein